MLDISKINIDIDEIKNILKEYSVKKKYYKLKNGDFLDLTKSQDLELLDEITMSLDIDYSKIENGVVELPVNMSIYLEKLTQGTDNSINITKNEAFKEVVDNIGNNSIGEEIKIDKKFENILRDYQKTGYKWLKTLEFYRIWRNFS